MSEPTSVVRRVRWGPQTVTMFRHLHRAGPSCQGAILAARSLYYAHHGSSKAIKPERDGGNAVSMNLNEFVHFTFLSISQRSKNMTAANLYADNKLVG